MQNEELTKSYSTKTPHKSILEQSHQVEIVVTTDAKI